MAHRRGVLAVMRRRLKIGVITPEVFHYVEDLLKDPCVYCGQYGCDTLDHIVPFSTKDKLATGFGMMHWTNLAPAHKGCNGRRGSKSIFYLHRGFHGFMA